MSEKKGIFKKIGNMSEKDKVRLVVAAQHSPSLNPTSSPPCETCVSVCCKAFIVSLTKEEYESGMYADQAIHIPEGILNTDKTWGALVHYPHMGFLLDGREHFVLEGGIDQACPFLSDDNKCSIYHSRPLTCRMYSCIGDARITDDMRSGKE